MTRMALRKALAGTQPRRALLAAPLVATDAGGNNSAPKQLAFRVVRR